MVCACVPRIPQKVCHLPVPALSDTGICSRDSSVGATQQGLPTHTVIGHRHRKYVALDAQAAVDFPAPLFPRLAPLMCFKDFLRWLKSKTLFDGESTQSSKSTLPPSSGLLKIHRKGYICCCCHLPQARLPSPTQKGGSLPQSSSPETHKGGFLVAAAACLSPEQKRGVACCCCQ